MQRNYLALLRCPDCKSPFDVRSDTGSGDVEFGVLTCACRQYPVVSGIPVLATDALTRMATDLVRAGDETLARRLLLNDRRHATVARRMPCSLASNVESVPQLVCRYIRTCVAAESAFSTSRPRSFAAAISGVPTDSFREYLLYRPFEQSYWTLHAFLPVLARKDGPVLDFGGGWGHSSRLMRRATDRPVWNLEVDFAPLFAQRSFVDREVPSVVVEPGADLPFDPDTFGTLVDLDGFQNVRNKYGIAREYQRVVRDDGRLLLLHTHNALHREDNGVSLEPAEYAGCFDWAVDTIPEERLLDAFLEADSTVEVPRGDVRAARELNLVVTADGRSDLRLDKRTHPFAAWTDPVLVNPIYEPADTDEPHVLRRRRVGERFRDEFDFSFRHTESEYVLSTDTDVSELLYRGVVAPLPRSYAPDQPVVTPGTAVAVDE